MASEIENRLQVLEENYEYQDQLVETLNEVIVKQQQQIDELQEELKKFREDFMRITEQDEQGSDPPPPHY